MKQRFRFPSLVFIAAVIVLTSCSKTNKEGRFIPKTAAVAVIVNGKSFSAKLPWEEVKQNELFEQLYSDSSLEAYVKTALENPENTGIDTKKNLFFFVEKDSTGGYVAFEGTIKDAAKFKQFSSSVTKATESEKGGIHFLSNEKITASWDKEKFVIVVDAPEMNDQNKPGASSVKRDIVAVAGGIYSLSESNSLAKDEKFTTLVGSKGDVHFWMNIGALSSGNARNFSMEMLNLNKLSEGSFITGVANFENGRIDMDIRSYSGKEMTDINKKFSDAKLNTDMIKRIPSKDVAVLAAISFKPEGLREFIKLTGLEGFINLGAGQLGFTFDDFIKANKGDILFYVSDIKKDSAGKMGMNALFTASIGDKNSFGKLIAAGNKFLSKEKMGATTPVFFYNRSDNYFALGTEKLSVDKYISTANNNSFDFIDKASGSTSLFYLNFKTLMTGFNNQLTTDSLDNIVFQTTINTWENLIATGGGFKDGATTQHIEINLADKSTNSLKQLNKYLGILGSIQQQKKLKREKWMSDATSENDPSESVSQEEKKSK